MSDTVVAEMLKTIPSDASGRFILTVRNEGPGTVKQSDIEHVVKLLESKGAVSIVPFKGLPTIIANTNRAALKAAALSGRIINIQNDAVAKPQDK